MLTRYQDLVLPSLRRLVEHQRRQDPGERYHSRFLLSVADQLQGRGVDLAPRRGPWTVGARWLDGPGPDGIQVIPLVQRGTTVVMTDTWDEARRLAGLLNWCNAPSLARSFVPTARSPHSSPVANPEERTFRASAILRLDLPESPATPGRFPGSRLPRAIGNRLRFQSSTNCRGQ